MKHFMVSLEISTKDYSLQELTRLLGLDGDDISYSIGDIRFKGEASEYTVWKLESRIPEKAGIVEHLNDIQSIALEKGVFDPGRIPANCSASLDIGILYDTITCSIEIPPNYWKWMAENNISLEIICYPCSDDLEE